MNRTTHAFNVILVTNDSVVASNRRLIIGGIFDASFISLLTDLSLSIFDVLNLLMSRAQFTKLCG